MKKLPMPICDKCNKLVDLITAEQNPLCDKVTYTVKCHGAKEITEISRFLVASIPNFKLKAGRAFLQPETKQLIMAKSRGR